MTANTVQLLLNVEKSKFPDFLNMLKLFEFVQVENWGTLLDLEGPAAGFEADGTPVSDDELIASALDALDDQRFGRVQPLREFIAQSE